MGLSITSMLAAVASELVVASNLPAAAELTWFAKFSIFSLTYAFIALLESVAVLYFFYKKTDTIIPRWYSFARDWIIVKKAAKGKDALVRKGSNMLDTISHGVKEMSVPKPISDVLDSAADAAVGESFGENDDRKNNQSDDNGNNQISSSALKGIPEDSNQEDLNGSMESLSVKDIDFGVLNIKKRSGGNRDNPLAASFVSALSNGDDDPPRRESFPDSSFVKEPAENPELRSSLRLPRVQSRRSSFPPRDNWMHETQSVIIPRDADDVSLYFLSL